MPIDSRDWYKRKKKCPFCGNLIDPDQSHCSFCGRELPLSPRPRGPMDWKQEQRDEKARDGMGGEREESAEELPALQKCAVCGQTSLFWNAHRENYECLNPDCQAMGKTPDAVFSWKLAVGKVSKKREERHEHPTEQQEGKQEEAERQPVPKPGASPIESSMVRIGQYQNTGGKPMSVKVTYVLIIVIVIAAIAWGLVSYNNLLKARSELNLAAETISTLRMLIGTLETDLEIAKNDLAKTQGDLTSVRQELSSVQQELNSAKRTISSLESKIELYEDTWGSVASGIQPPFQGADIVSSGTATNPTWSQLSSFLLSDQTDRKAYLPGFYMCGDFARDVHNNAERAGIRAAYVAVTLGSEYHSLNAFKTIDRGLVFIDCTGLEAFEPGPSNRDKTVSVRIGRSYIPESLFPESGWSTTWVNMGTVRDVQIYW